MIAFAFLARIFYLFPNTIPFSFDHGKDSIAVLHMIKTFSPKFIGPWTSIPGLYFGPAWYYLLAPAYLFSGGNPVSAAVLMTLFVVVEVALAYKYFGKYEAIIMASAPGWLIISKSAWNPFPMTLLILCIMILLKEMRKRGEHREKIFFGLFFIASLEFHFSAAFAVLALLSLLLILTYRRVRLSAKVLGYSLLGFVLPFLPQLLFELKHQFVETKAVIAYFTQGEPQKWGLSKIQNVLTITLGEMKLAVLPELQKPFPLSAQTVLIFSVLLLFVGWVYVMRKKVGYPLWFESLAFVCIPLAGFFFLHFNYWYITALMPIAVLYVSHILKNAPRMIAWPYIFLLLLTPVFAYVRYFTFDRPQILQSREMLPAKVRALKYVYAEAGDKPFSSYQYVPDIYDYSYQYLYIWQAFHGRPLPSEFSYKPGEISYIPEKPSLLAKLYVQQLPPEKIFFIVEEPQNKDFLQAWWGQQKYGKIIQSVAISPQITVYTATPSEK